MVREGGHKVERHFVKHNKNYFVKIKVKLHMSDYLWIKNLTKTELTYHLTTPHTNTSGTPQGLAVFDVR